MNTNRLLTEQEVADLLHLKPKTIADWGRAGKLTRVKLSTRCVRYREQDVMALADSAVETRNPQAQNG
jgi:predicted site-specific integrase-resolvase